MLSSFFQRSKVNLLELVQEGPALQPRHHVDCSDLDLLQLLLVSFPIWGPDLYTVFLATRASPTTTYCTRKGGRS